MRVIETAKGVEDAVTQYRQDGKTIGFVPTMGALHEGHLYLTDCAREENDVVVVSIFVNPIQFNDKKDLEKYPRDLERDIKLLHEHDVAVVFAPTVKEMYPEESDRKYEFGELETVMEGKFRPGHFNGVATVVHRLFDIVKPQKSYFGEKDFQQLAIIKQLVKNENIDVDVVGCRIIREADGLAMSSRNQRLSSSERKSSTLLYRLLQEAQSLKKNKTVEEVKQYISENIKQSDFELDYFEIVDSITLQPVDEWDSSTSIRGCIAAYLGNVRLIDNIAL